MSSELVRIPLRDLAAQDFSLRSELRAAVDTVLASGAYVGGVHGAALEEDLARELGVRHVIGVNSGTDALVLALRAAEIGSGDEVIVPSYTFVATASAVSLAGAVPVFVDSAPGRFVMDVAAAERSVTSRTRALIAVHIFGEPAELELLGGLCAWHGILLIEDAAQAFGARYRGRPVGGAAALAALSFYPTKNLACAGDGGAVATNDDAFAVTIRSLRDHGRGDTRTHVRLGVNSRLDEIQAAMLRVKLPYVERWNAQRRALAEAYRDGLRGTAAYVADVPPDVVHVYNQFVIGHPQRDELRAHLDRAGIATAVYYAPPCHQQPMYAHADAPHLPVAEEWSRTALALPIYPELPVTAVERICAEIRAFALAKY